MYTLAGLCDFLAPICRQRSLTASLPIPMHRYLIKLTPAQAEQQQQRLADEAAVAVAAAAAAATRAPPRGPGRPRSAASVTTLFSEFACSPSSSDDDDNDAAAAPSHKRSYTSWLTSDAFHLIHDAVRRRQSFRGAARDLQQRFPRLPTQQHGTYDLLRASTLRRWYARDNTGAIKLRPEYERFLGANNAMQPVAGGSGPQTWWEKHPDATQAIREALQALRDEERVGIAVGLRLVRWTVAAVAEKLQLPDPPLCNASLSRFVHRVLNWTWRCRTTAAGKLPEDWQAQLEGTQMAQRIAVHIEFSEVDESLIVNWDQTGVILMIPAASRTYEKQGETRVAVLGAEEKRQITAVLASSMADDMLPLQLIFAGKTERSRPAATAASTAAAFHLTSSENHWSTQQTMREYIEHVIEPYRQRKVKEKGLKHDSRMVLVLDAWSVHRAEEFRV